jgi:hypothetical protein
MLRNGASRILLGLGIILIGLASKIDPDYVRYAVMNLSNLDVDRDNRDEM